MWGLGDKSQKADERDLSSGTVITQRKYEISGAKWFLGMEQYPGPVCAHPFLSYVFNLVSQASIPCMIISTAMVPTNKAVILPATST